MIKLFPLQIWFMVKENVTIFIRSMWNALTRPGVVLDQTLLLGTTRFACASLSVGLLYF